MKFLSPVWLLLAAALVLPARSAEQNAWPWTVRNRDETPAGPVTTIEALGPLFFAQSRPGAVEEYAFRPFVYRTSEPGKLDAYLLYPLFMWRQRAGYSTFSILDLVNQSDSAAGGTLPQTQRFDVWPVYFSRQTGDPATSYRAFFPIGGTIKQRFGDDRLTWVLFPGYLRTESRGRQTTYAPWPVVRVTTGAGHHGFELWPLFGEKGRAGDYHDQYWIWPLFYRSASHLSAPVPDVTYGALPFFTHDYGPGYEDRNFLWPFCGVTHRTLPARYDEIRYVWPFLVQGRGDGRYVNRWGPLFTHSVVKGYDKTWLIWPLYRHAEWMEAGLKQTQDRLLFFVYWSLVETDPRRPNAAPAYKRHLWPLISAWDNGAGRWQVQLLSPFEVFFPNNEVVRRVYSPLFAVLRAEQLAPDERRGSLLWGLYTWHTTPAAAEYHVGPLFSRERSAAGARVSVGSGLLGWRREGADGRWRFFLFDFPSRSDTKAAPAFPSP